MNLRKLGFFSRKINASFSTQKLSGIISPIITPLNEDALVDAVSLKNLVARLMNKGVHNFFVFSRFSEFDQLVFDQRETVLQTVSSELSKKGLLIVGCFAKTSEEIISLINSAEKYADICAINLPLSAMSSELEFADFFESLVSQTRCKIILYNNPFLFKQSIPFNLLENLINWERFVGVIDASRNPDYFEELSKYAQLIRLFEENEEFAFDALRKNFAGLCCVSTLLFPSYYLQLFDNFDGMDYKKLMRNEARVIALNKLILPVKRIQAIKHVLFLQGIIQPFYFNNLEVLTDKEKFIIEETLWVYKKESPLKANLKNNIL